MGFCSSQVYYFLPKPQETVVLSRDHDLLDENFKIKLFFLSYAKMRFEKLMKLKDDQSHGLALTGLVMQA